MEDRPAQDQWAPFSTADVWAGRGLYRMPSGMSIGGGGSGDDGDDAISLLLPGPHIQRAGDGRTGALPGAAGAGPVRRKQGCGDVNILTAPIAAEVATPVIGSADDGASEGGTDSSGPVPVDTPDLLTDETSITVVEKGVSLSAPVSSEGTTPNAAAVVCRPPVPPPLPRKDGLGARVGPPAAAATAAAATGAEAEAPCYELWVDNSARSSACFLHASAVSTGGAGAAGASAGAGGVGGGGLEDGAEGTIASAGGGGGRSHGEGSARTRARALARARARRARIEARAAAGELRVGSDASSAPTLAAASSAASGAEAARASTTDAGFGAGTSSKSSNTVFGAGSGAEQRPGAGEDAWTPLPFGRATCDGAQWRSREHMDIRRRVVMVVFKYMKPIFPLLGQPDDTSQALDIARRAELILYERAASLVDYVRADTVVDRLRWVMELFSVAARAYDSTIGYDGMSTCPGQRPFRQRTGDGVGRSYSAGAAHLTAPHGLGSGCVVPWVDPSVVLSGASPSTAAGVWGGQSSVADWSAASMVAATAATARAETGAGTGAGSVGIGDAMVAQTSTVSVGPQTAVLRQLQFASRR